MKKDGPFVLTKDDHTVLPELPAGHPAGVFAQAARHREVSLQ